MVRNDWALEEILQLFSMPFGDLLFKAHSVHREHWQHNEVQLAALLSVKTGSCPENCSYCAQSAHYNTGLVKQALMDVESVRQAAKKAKEAGASRFCFAAAWRNLHDRDVDRMCQFVKVIKDENLESCASLGMLKLEQAERLKEVGLDFYNHNIDTSRDFYRNIITTRTYDDRLETVRNVQKAGIRLCCGGILGMGESTKDRAEMLLTLANLEQHPMSVPINRLVPIEGTPLENHGSQISNIDFVKTIAVARILMPESCVRLAAGRESMSEEMQALCLYAGANSIFFGERLLTTPNSVAEKDMLLLSKLGITSSTIPVVSPTVGPAG